MPGDRLNIIQKGNAPERESQGHCQNENVEKEVSRGTAKLGKRITDGIYMI